MKRFKGAFLTAWALGATVLAILLFMSGRMRESVEVPSEGVNLGTDLVIWMYGLEAERIHNQLFRFRRENPDVEIRVVEKPWTDLPGEALPNTPPEEMPSLIQVGSTWMPGLIDAGLLIPLEGRLAEAGIRPENFVPIAWQSYRSEDHLWAVPWYLELRALFVRTDLVPEPPATWNDIHRLASSFETDLDGDGSPDRYLISLPYNEWTGLGIFMEEMGGDISRPDSPEGRRALNEYLRFFREDLSPFGPFEETRDPQASFAGGYFAMMVSGPWDVRQMGIEFPGMEDSWTVVPIPAWERRSTPLGGAGWAVPVGAPAPEAALKFAEYMSRPAQQQEWLTYFGNLPTVAEAWDYRSSLGDQRFRAFDDSLDEAFRPPAVPGWEEYARAVGDALHGAVAGDITEEEAISRMAEAADNLVAADSEGAE